LTDTFKPQNQKFMTATPERNGIVDRCGSGTEGPAWRVLCKLVVVL
jgi:hypothetical protein